MTSLAQRLLKHVQRHELLKPGDRVGVAVSGGIDSVALLRLMLELRIEIGIVVAVVHFNHKLRGVESDGDEQFVGELAREHDLEFYCDREDVAQHAAEEQISVESAARELRYGFFRHILGENGDPQGLKAPVTDASSRGPERPLFHRLDKILTGHTLDDQAETVLMRMIRGAGLKGLGGIHPRLLVEDEAGELCGEILRPLLEFRRRELKQYLFEIQQSWRDDSSNESPYFTRNRLRQLVVPLLEQEFNPAVAENLAELAEIARGEEDYWENEVAGWMGTAVHWVEPEWVRGAVGGELVQIRLGASNPDDASDLRSAIEKASWLVQNASLDRLWFLGEPVAVQRRVIKAIGDHAGVPLEFKHVEEIVRFASETGNPGKELSLPLGWKLVREPESLRFVTPDLRQQPESCDYEYQLPVPGRVIVVELNATLEARIVPAGGEAGYNPDHLLNPDSLTRSLRVRNWRAGDRFWPGHTKSPKKIKELLQEHHARQPGRSLWPVVLSGSEIVWVRGFAVARNRQAKPGEAAVVIFEMPLSVEARLAGQD